MIKGILVAALAAVVMSSCVVRNLVRGPQLTGTCTGACDHYVECKPGHSEADRTRCNAECPDVFADRDSLMAFESMSCRNTVEFVDGTGGHAARTP